MPNITASSSQKFVVWKIRFADQVRCFIGASCHFFLKCLRVELRGYQEHSTLISNATYSPWRVDNQFNDVMKSIASYTLLDKMRLYELWQLANQVKHLQGHAIEIGCWRGGAGCLIAHRIAQEKNDSQVYLCDTFRGIVKACDHDTFYQGQELADSSEALVADLAKRMHLNNVTILPGIFPEESSTQVESLIFKFAHIDVDVYQSAKDAFEWLFPRLVNGGIVVFDDYGSASTPGIRKYINEELQDRADVVVVRNLNGQAVVVKR